MVGWLWTCGTGYANLRHSLGLVVQESFDLSYGGRNCGRMEACSV
jgi:hypothetical protein